MNLKEISIELKDQIIQAKKQNPSLTNIQLGGIFNLSSYFISNILKEFSCTTEDLIGQRYRKYNVDDNYFNKINSNNKDYLLGVWYADGYLVKEGNNTKRVGLDVKDVDWLEDIKKELKLEAPIYKTDKEQIKRLKLTSNIMYDDLIKLGCVEHKTFLIKFPTIEQVPFEFLNSFILGYLDGDGSIVIGSPRKQNWSPDIQINFTGTKELLIGIQKYFKKEKLKLDKRWKNRDNNNYSLNIAGIQQVYPILNLLYNNAPEFCLKRKKEKFEKIKNDSRIKLKDLMLIPANPYDIGV